MTIQEFIQEQGQTIKALAKAFYGYDVTNQKEIVAFIYEDDELYWMAKNMGVNL